MPTKIEWCEESWNPITGCSKVATGCKNCYAERMATRLQRMGVKGYEGVTEDGRWTGRVNLIESALAKPLHWKKPREIFVNSMSDLFHPEVKTEWIRRVFSTIELCPQHRFIILTKRPKRMKSFLFGTANIHRRGMGNCWIGASASTQKDFNAVSEPVAELAAWGWKTVFSLEPMVEEIDISWITGLIELDPDEKEPMGLFLHHPQCPNYCDYACGGIGFEDGRAPVSFIVGGESGPGARPMHPDWARKVRDDCAAADVPFYLKQWGENVPVEREAFEAVWTGQDGETHPESLDIRKWDSFHGWIHVGKKAAGRLLDGRIHDALPWREGRG